MNNKLFLFLRNPNLYVALVIFIISIFALAYSPKAEGQQRTLADENIFRADVVEVVAERPITVSYSQRTQIEQELLVTLHVGAQTQQTTVLNDYTPVKTGDRIIVQGSLVGEKDESFAVVDVERTRGLWALAVLFSAVSWAVGGRKSVYALVGLVFSIAVVISLLIPLLLAGFNAVLVGVLCAGLILFVSLYLTHGLNEKSFAALAGIIITLGVVGIISHVSVTMLHFTGFGGEEAIYLTQETKGAIDLVGLLIAGILIAAIGVLDDVAVTQVSIVSNLRHLNPALEPRKLFAKAMEVGRDHISAVINTLVMAYVGAGLPLLLLLKLQQFPPELVIGGENLAEEIVRTLISTTGLVLTVPITTALAVWWGNSVRTSTQETSQKVA